MPNYTEIELQAIFELRQRLVDLRLDEEKTSGAYLIKWLRAQHLNIGKAEEMLRKSLIWRQENEIDLICEWSPPPALSYALPIEICGYDRDGNTIVVSPMKYTDLSIAVRVPKEDYIKSRIQSVEKLLEGMRVRNASQGQGQGRLQGNQVISITDLEGFPFSTTLLSPKFMELMKETGQILDAHYPEFTKLSFVTHAPRLIARCISMLKPIIPASAYERTKIFDSNSKKWGPEILACNIDADQIPPRYGGTNVDFELNAFLPYKNK